MSKRLKIGNDRCEWNMISVLKSKMINFSTRDCPKTINYKTTVQLVEQPTSCQTRIENVRQLAANYVARFCMMFPLAFILVME